MFNYIDIKPMKIYPEKNSKIYILVILSVLFMYSPFHMRSESSYNVTWQCATIYALEVSNLIDLYKEYALFSFSVKDSEVNLNRFAIFVSFSKIKNRENCYVIQINGVDGFTYGYDYMIAYAVQSRKNKETVNILISDYNDVGNGRFYRVNPLRYITFTQSNCFYIVSRDMAQILLYYDNDILKTVEAYPILETDKSFFNKEVIGDIIGPNVKLIIH